MLLMQHFYDDDRRQYFLYESMLLDNVGYIGLEFQCHRNGYNSMGPNGTIFSLLLEQVIFSRGQWSEWAVCIGITTFG